MFLINFQIPRYHELVTKLEEKKVCYMGVTCTTPLYTTSI